MRVVFVARSLGVGGAERQLVATAIGLHRRGHDVHAVLFYLGEPLQAELEAAGVPVLGMGKTGRWHLLGFFATFVRTLKSLRPDVIYSYLEVPNVVTALMRPLVRRTKLVWGIRASDMDLSKYDRTVRASYWLARRLSRLADLSVSNSFAGRDFAAAQGYPAEKMIVIPNGIDVERFSFDEGARGRVRAEWGIGDEEILVGNIGRQDEMKDHENLLRAAAIVLRERPELRFVCVGKRYPHRFPVLQALSAELGVADRLIWADPTNDIACTLSALDLHCSSSAYGEGFSNAIGEAMSCEVPCVVTDVGDSALIVADTGWVVPARDPRQLAAAILAAASKCRDPEVRSAARRRIVEEFSLERMVLKTEEAITGLVGAHVGGA